LSVNQDLIQLITFVMRNDLAGGNISFGFGDGTRLGFFVNVIENRNWIAHKTSPERSCKISCVMPCRKANAQQE
jgi:hypothetical protein